MRKHERQPTIKFQHAIHFPDALRDEVIVLLFAFVLLSAFDSFLLIIFFRDFQIQPRIPHNRKIKIRNFLAVGRVGVNVIYAFFRNPFEICSCAFDDLNVINGFIIDAVAHVFLSVLHFFISKSKEFDRINFDWPWRNSISVISKCSSITATISSRRG